MPVEARQYPVNLVIEGKPCLVVGGGDVAARKAAGLLDCGARTHLVATEVGPGVRGLEASGLTWEERPYRAGEAAGYRLVLAATDDPAVSQAVYRDAEEAGVWVNTADDPAACTFTLPSVARQGPVMVTVSTSGHSPALATWLKGRLADQVGPELAAAALILSEARDQLRAAGRSTEGLDWQKALDSDMLGLIRAGQIGQARERLRACLSLS